MTPIGIHRNELLVMMKSMVPGQRIRVDGEEWIRQAAEWLWVNPEDGSAIEILPWYLDATMDEKPYFQVEDI